MPLRLSDGMLPSWWGGPPGPRPTPSSACSHCAGIGTGESWPRGHPDLGVRPTRLRVRRPCALSVPYRNLIHHLDAEAFERHDLPRMVGQQTDRVQPQIGEYLRPDAVFVLQLPLAGLTFVVHEVAPVAEYARRVRALAVDAEPGAGLVQVNQHSRPRFGDGGQGVPDQARALALVGSEHIAEER